MKRIWTNGLQYKIIDFYFIKKATTTERKKKKRKRDLNIWPRRSSYLAVWCWPLNGLQQWLRKQVNLLNQLNFFLSCHFLPLSPCYWGYCCVKARKTIFYNFFYFLIFHLFISLNRIWFLLPFYLFMEFSIV